jgi:oxygen-independent coproporphyrinogen-3 oxidase
MGIQSLSENILEAINRKHTHEKTIDACNLILNQGFILNIDLIYGLPGQTMKSFEDDLNLLAKIGVPSFTVYNLRINQNTKIVKKFKDNELLNIKKIIEWRNFIKKTAENLGYEQTRWHTFKKKNSNASEHKRLPTSDQDLMGYQFGAGVSARSSINHKVYRNISNIKEYIQRIESGISPVDEIIHLGQEDLKTIHISRTLGDGNELDIDDYKEIFNTGFYSDFPGVIDQLISGELLELSGSKLKLSDEGKSLYDIVTLAFYPKEVKQSMLERLDNFHYA